jgi:hypothetical protein
VAVLKLGCAAMLGATACYAPELRDCVTACEIEADCPPGQACGNDRLCAGPVMAGRCSMLTQPDAALPDAAPAPADAAPHPDAPVPQDAVMAVLLHVRIQSHGKVVIDGVATCDSEGDDHGDCTFAALAGPAMLHAIPRADRVFDTWTSEACSGQGPNCTTTFSAPFADVRVRFRNP